MANWRVPEFSLSNCAQSLKKTFMCPKFHTNPVLKYTKCHISTNLSSFPKLCLLYCQKYLPLLRQIADSLKKNWFSENTAWKYTCILHTKRFKYQKHHSAYSQLEFHSTPIKTHMLTVELDGRFHPQVSIKKAGHCSVP